jgi:hypothetical protein
MVADSSGSPLLCGGQVRWFLKSHSHTHILSCLAISVTLTAGIGRHANLKCLFNTITHLSLKAILQAGSKLQ